MPAVDTKNRWLHAYDMHISLRTPVLLVSEESSLMNFLFILSVKKLLNELKILLGYAWVHCLNMMKAPVAFLLVLIMKQQSWRGTYAMLFRVLDHSFFMCF